MKSGAKLENGENATKKKTKLEFSVIFIAFQTLLITK